MNQGTLQGYDFSGLIRVYTNYACIIVKYIVVPVVIIKYIVVPVITVIWCHIFRLSR